MAFFFQVRFILYHSCTAGFINKLQCTCSMLFCTDRSEHSIVVMVEVVHISLLRVLLSSFASLSCLSFRILGSKHSHINVFRFSNMFVVLHVNSTKATRNCFTLTELITAFSNEFSIATNTAEEILAYTVFLDTLLRLLSTTILISQIGI